MIVGESLSGKLRLDCVRRVIVFVALSNTGFITYHALPVAVLTPLAVADQGHPAQENGRSRGTARSMLQHMTKGK